MRNLKVNNLILLLFLSALIVVFDSRGILDPVKSAAQVMTAPVKYSFYNAKLGLEDFFSFLTFWRSGEERIKNLEQRNLELIAFESQVKNLQRENGELRKQLGVKSQPAGQKILPAMVLGTGQYLEISEGANSGVRQGDGVVYLGNLVGRVFRLTSQTSFVRLPNDSQAVIAVKVGSVNGLVFGQFNSSMILDRIAQNEEIKVDDLVVTSGEGGNFPPGLIVGKIKKIASLPTDLFAKAEVVPLLDYGKLTTVFVVLPDK